MSRFFKIIPMDEFKNKIEKENIFNNKTIIKDLSKVDFDFENIFEGNVENDHTDYKELVGFNSLPNGMVYYGAWAGGDWEYPVFFVIYYDGVKLRGYIPREGNAWNKKDKCAWDFEEDEDQINVDIEKIKIDIQKRILPIAEQSKGFDLSKVPTPVLIEEIERRSRTFK